MADEQKPIQTAPTSPPVVDTGIVNNVPTVSGTERLGNIDVLPPVNILSGVENMVKVEKQPGDQISIESPITAPDKVVDINRSPAVPSVQQVSQAPSSEPQAQSKVLSLDEAIEILKKRKQIIPFGDSHPDSKIVEAAIVDREEQKAA